MIIFLKTHTSTGNKFYFSVYNSYPIFTTGNPTIQSKIHLLYSPPHNPPPDIPLPQLAIACSIGINDTPAGLNWYSTRGGNSLYSFLFTSPKSSSSFSSFASTLLEMAGINWLSLPKSPITFSIMGPPIILIARVTGQSRGFAVKRGEEIVVTIWLPVLVNAVTKIHYYR